MKQIPRHMPIILSVIFLLFNTTSCSKSFHPNCNKIIDDSSIKNIGFRLKYTHTNSGIKIFGINFGAIDYKTVVVHNDDYLITSDKSRTEDSEDKRNEIAERLNLQHGKFYNEYGSINAYNQYEDIKFAISSRPVDSSKEYGTQKLFAFLITEEKIRILEYEYELNAIGKYKNPIIRYNNKIYIYNYFCVDLFDDTIYPVSNGITNQFDDYSEEDKMNYVNRIIAGNKELKGYTDKIKLGNTIMIDEYNGTAFFVITSGHYDYILAYEEKNKKIIYAMELEHSSFRLNDAELVIYKGESEIYDPIILITPYES